MDITKSREDFEAWAEKNGYRMDLIPDGDIYSYSSTRCSWEAWKASRESLVVELPEMLPDEGYSDGAMHNFCRNDSVKKCAKVLRTAGIRIKGESE